MIPPSLRGCLLIPSPHQLGCLRSGPHAQSAASLPKMIIDSVWGNSQFASDGLRGSEMLPSDAGKLLRGEQCPWIDRRDRGLLNAAVKASGSWPLFNRKQHPPATRRRRVRVAATIEVIGAAQAARKPDQASRSRNFRSSNFAQYPIPGRKRNNGLLTCFRECG